MNLADATEDQLRTALELKEAERLLLRLSEEMTELMKMTAPDLCRRLD